MSERDQVGAALSEAQATCSHHTLPGRILPQLDKALSSLKNTNFKVKPN